MSLLAAVVLTVSPKVFVSGAIYEVGGKLTFEIRAQSADKSVWSLDPGKVKLVATASNPAVKPTLEFADATRLVRSNPDGTLTWSSPLRLELPQPEGTWIKLRAYSGAAVAGVDRKLVKEHNPGALDFYRPSTSGDRVRQLESSLVGRQVWVFGSSAFTRTPGEILEWPAMKSVKVVKVEVSALPADRWATVGKNPTIGETSYWRPETFYAPRPLWIWVEAPSAQKGIPPTLGAVEVADAWMAPYRLTLTPPSRELRNRLSRPRDVDRGMAKEELVRRYGYPQFRDTLKTLWGQRKWTYYGPTPFGADVYFDNQNRIRKVEYFGDLP